jgi:uncharacterized SAM-binding protein YcdF (DUF218 family)
VFSRWAGVGEDPLKLVDAVVVLGGGLGASTLARLAKGIEVLKSTSCEKLILVGSDEEVEFMKRKAVEYGAREELLFCVGGSRNTIDNAYYAKKVLKAMGIKRIALVTSDFHIERALAIFEWVLGEGYEIIPVAASDNPSREVLEREELLKNLIPFMKKLLKKGDDEGIKRLADKLHKLLRKLQLI